MKRVKAERRMSVRVRKRDLKEAFLEIFQISGSSSRPKKERRRRRRKRKLANYETREGEMRKMERNVYIYIYTHTHRQACTHITHALTHTNNPTSNTPAETRESGRKG